MSPAPLPATRRVSVPHDVPADAQARYVLYWMVAHRRTTANEAMDRAIAWCRELDKPLLVLEALSASYEHASDRIHQFVLEGMRDNAAACAKAGVRYLRYVEPEAGAGRGLVRALAAHAAVVVTDDHPAHPHLDLTARPGATATCRFEYVDACGLVPIRRTPTAFPTAYAFRRFLQRELLGFLEDRPRRDPLRSLPDVATARVPRDILDRWPELRADPAADPAPVLEALDIDHEVVRGALAGGAKAGQARLRRFVKEDLSSYADERNHPDLGRESGLSPYLHFGHVGAGEVFDAIVRAEEWTPDRCKTDARGKRSGWWGMSASAEAFLDQLITWRELGLNTCAHLPDSYDTFDSLPGWARRTLAAHADDPRPYTYTLRQLETATTHDEVWNAAQRQLVRDGVLHNYLRMNWGKRIIEWSPTPVQALERMILLNDKYALDGRDPNSYSGILWCFGRYDRAWGPERPIFGTVRYMTSAQTRKKLRMKAYLETYGPDAGQGELFA